jgi:hypothetical protein
MGTWGVGITDNDTSTDVYADFVLLLKTNSIEQVMEKMTAHYQSKINSHEEQYNFWLAIAMAQLDTNTLQIEILEKVKKFILSGEELLLWKELNASESDINLRKEVLNDFLTLLTGNKK